MRILRFLLGGDWWLWLLPLGAGGAWLDLVAIVREEVRKCTDKAIPLLSQANVVIGGGALVARERDSCITQMLASLMESCTPSLHCIR